MSSHIHVSRRNVSIIIFYVLYVCFKNGPNYLSYSDKKFKYLKRFIKKKQKECFKNSRRIFCYTYYA